MTQVPRVVWILFIAAVSACASVKPAPVDFYVNVGREIADLESEIARDRASHVGLLAPTELDAAQIHVRRAADKRARIEPRDDVLRQLGLVHAHLDRAAEIVRARYVDLGDVLSAREGALDAGVLRVDDARAALGKLDARLREGYADRDSRREEMRTAYRELERVAVVERVLKGAKEDVARALAHFAATVAPASLAAAEGAIGAAAQIVARYDREPAAYRDAVLTAENRSRALNAIVDEARVVGQSTDEDVARELLVQRQRVDQLRAEMAGVELTVAAKDLGLQNARAENEFNAALSRAREGLVASDADVYRAGDDLLIRLKSGADPTLTKVKGVIRDLNARDVRVQGGTANDAAAVAQSLAEIAEVARTVDPAVEPTAPVEVLIRPRMTEPQ